MSDIFTDREFHLKTTKEDVGEYVILCGDPARVPKIAAYFENAKKVAENREFTVYTGSIDGVSVSAASTGIGGPSAAICVEELVHCGAKTFIRVGTSGGIDERVVGGDLVIATSAVRAEGTSFEYLPAGYPAVADFKVVRALSDEAKELCDNTLGNSYHVGVVQSKDSFYGETDPETMPVSEQLKNNWRAYMALGCLTSEMECAAIFSVAQTRAVASGAVLLAMWNVERSKKGLENPVVHDTDRAIRCAVGAIRRLIRGE